MAKIKKKPEAVNQKQFEEDIKSGRIVKEVEIKVGASVKNDQNVEITELFEQILGYIKVNKATNTMGLVIVQRDLLRPLRLLVQNKVEGEDRIKITLISSQDFELFNKHNKFGWIIIDKGLHEDDYAKIKQQTRTLIRI